MLDNTLNETGTDNDIQVTDIDIKKLKISRASKIFSGIKELVIYFLVSLVLIVTIRMYVIQHVRIEGTSMEPMFKDGQHLLIEKVSYKFVDIKRFDVVVFRPYYDKNDTYYVKRVIGLPGETVQIKDSVIYINGKPIEENYGANSYTDGKKAVEKIQLGDYDYFVLGDNRSVSKDSREADIGLVNKDSIKGKAWISIYPFDKLGIIKH